MFKLKFSFIKQKFGKLNSQDGSGSVVKNSDVSVKVPVLFQHFYTLFFYPMVIVLLEHFNPVIYTCLVSAL